MELKKITEIIDGEFILYKREKIGTFEKEDIGYEKYEEEYVINISVENGKISIALES